MTPPLNEHFEANNQIARANRSDFGAAGTTVISIVGPAGSGKTSLIETIFLRIAPPVRAAVIVGNLAADRHISQFTRHGYPAVSVTTDHLEARHIREVLPSLNLAGLDLLLIEANGNTLGPVEFDLGQHLRVGVFSAAGGDDKVHEFPFLVQGADLVLLTKVDLLPFVSFDLNIFQQDIRRLNPDLPFLSLSMQSNQGITQLLQWIKSNLPSEITHRRGPRIFDPFVKSSER